MELIHTDTDKPGYWTSWTAPHWLYVLLTYYGCVLSSLVLKLFGQLPTYSWYTVTAGIWGPIVLGIGLWGILGIWHLAEWWQKRKGWPQS